MNADCRQRKEAWESDENVFMSFGNPIIVWHGKKFNFTAVLVDRSGVIFKIG